MRKVDKSVFLVRELTWLAALIALQMILGKLSIGNDIVKIGFGFVANALIGYYFGPFKAAIAGVAGDIISNTILPSSGGFFWGFTLSALVTGLIYGSILYKKEVTIWRVILVTVLIVVIIDTLMNTYWISIMANAPFKVMFATRIVKEIITIPIQATILYLVLRWVDNSRFKSLN